MAEPPPTKPARLAEPAAGTAIVHPIDGAVMVYVPSGEFTMGMDKDEAIKLAAALGYSDYHKIAAEEWFPKRRVYVEGFFIDKYEVTVGRWNAFAAATKYTPKVSKGPEPGFQGHAELFPAVSVTWAEAQKYANWAGKSLPYERQWEKAARGTDARWFPWGNEPPTPERGAFVDLGKEHRNQPTHAEMVGSHPSGASPYGCMDMAGNAYEWTCEWFEPYPNNPEYQRMLPYTGHTNGVLRGGSFYHADHAYCAAKRFGFKPDETYFHVGFRTVWVPPAGYFDSLAFKQAREKVAARVAEIARLRTGQ
jgi:formylglycine-generating enzyme required for sulfatase activity